MRARLAPTSAMAALCLVMTLAACSGDDSSSKASSASSAATASSAAAASTAAASPTTAAGSGAASAGADAVTAKDFAFSPSTLNVKVGATVKMTNSDSATHTFTADDGAFDSGRVGSGESFTFTFPKAGTFAFHCGIHRSMKGTIVVA